MSNWGYRFVISTKRLIRRIKAIIKDTLTVIGVLVMIAEASSEIFGFDGLFESYKNHIWLIVGFVVTGCIIKNWDHLVKTVRIANLPDVTITLKVCDALRNRGAVIIPTNTTFDTKMDDEFISEGSIQGQYQIKYFKNRLNDLNSKIKIGLDGKK